MSRAMMRPLGNHDASVSLPHPIASHLSSSIVDLEIKGSEFAKVMLCQCISGASRRFGRIKKPGSVKAALASNDAEESAVNFGHSTKAGPVLAVQTKPGVRAIVGMISNPQIAAAIIETVMIAVVYQRIIWTKIQHEPMQIDKPVWASSSA
jgi:hypothetical protein